MGTVKLLTPAFSSGSGAMTNTKSGWVTYAKWGRVVCLELWVQTASALACYTERQYATGLPPAITSGAAMGHGALTMDGGGVCAAYVDTSGQLKIMARATQLAAGGVAYGGFCYIAGS